MEDYSEGIKINCEGKDFCPVCDSVILDNEIGCAWCNVRDINDAI